jgi:hypothetical protein
MNLLSYIIENVCLDSRIKDGIFSMENNDHLSILQEYLETTLNLDESSSAEIRNAMVEGKYPERQAYNAAGLLVTFPTPEYKQRAIARGTHFEENPKKAAGANVFAPEPQSAEQPQEPTQSSTPEPQQPETPAEKDEEEPDLRTPQEKQADAQTVQTILTTEYSLEEAKANGFYNKGSTWYTGEGSEVGIARYVEDIGKIMIRPKK